MKEALLWLNFQKIADKVNSMKVLFDQHKTKVYLIKNNDIIIQYSGCMYLQTITKPTIAIN